MTTAKLIEYRIARQLLLRRETGAERGGKPQADIQPWADRLIAVLALTAGLLILGSYLEELLWAILAAVTVFTLR